MMARKRMVDEKEVQNAMMVYQLLQGQLEQLKQQGAHVQSRFAEVETTRLGLEEMKDLKDETEILIPLGSGVYSTEKHMKNSTLLVDLGAGVMIKKTPQEALEIIEKKKTDVEKLTTKLQQEMTSVITQINQLGTQLEAFMAQAKK